VNVEAVDDRLEVAQDVVVPTHVCRHDAAYDVFAKASKLLRRQVLERVRRALLEHPESVRAVVVLEWSDVVVAVCQRSTSTYLYARTKPRNGGGCRCWLLGDDRPASAS